MSARSVKLARAHERLTKEGYNCYEIPVRRCQSDRISRFYCWFVELAEQEAMGQAFDYYLVHATGSGGTMAGLVAGKKLLEHPTRILFDVIGLIKYSYLENSKLGNESLTWLGAEACLTAEDFEHDNQYFLPGYEMPSEAEMMRFGCWQREEDRF